MEVLRNGRLSDFQKGQSVCARLAGASVIKTATLLGLSTSAVAKVMLGLSTAAVAKVITAYTNRGKTSLGARNCVRKPYLSRRYCRKSRRAVSKNRATTRAQVTAELNIHLEDSVSTKHPDKSFTNPASTVNLLLLNI
jgi:hypothetical protein